MQKEDKKFIEVKVGNKTTYCLKPKSDEGIEQKDLTTSGRHSIGYSDIPKEQWDKIFGQKSIFTERKVCYGNKTT